MLVSELKLTQAEKLPHWFLDILPDTCGIDGCNSPTQITPTLTELSCSNPRCPSRLARRLDMMLDSLGIKGLGKAGARGVVQNFGMTNPLQIFAYEPSEDGQLAPNVGEAASLKIYEQLKKKNTFTLPEYVKIAQLPNIQSSAFDIFGGYTSLEDAYKDIEHGNIQFIASKLGIGKNTCSSDELYKEKAESMYSDYLEGTLSEQSLREFLDLEDDISIREELANVGVAPILEKVKAKIPLSEISSVAISVRAVKIYESLMFFKEDLFEGLNYVNIVNPDVKILKVVCSTSVGEPFKSKQEFFDFINTKYKNTVHVEFLGSVSKKIDILVWSGGSNPKEYFERTGVEPEVTGKVRKTRSLNEKFLHNQSLGLTKENEHYIPILSAQEFIKYIEGGA